LLAFQVSVAVPPIGTSSGTTFKVTVGTGAEIDTVAVLVARLALLEQVSVYMDVASSGPVDCEPLVACVPLQAPPAVQLVAFCELQVRVDEPPLGTVGGVALIVAVAGAVMPTVTDRERLPPIPVQFNVKVDRADNAPVLAEPFGDLVPLHAPLAVQLVASVELQVSVEAPPPTTFVGLALRVTAGLGTTTT
jgi:hypothetical protein